LTPLWKKPLGQRTNIYTYPAINELRGKILSVFSVQLQRSRMGQQPAQRNDDARADYRAGTVAARVFRARQNAPARRPVVRQQLPAHRFGMETPCADLRHRFQDTIVPFAGKSFTVPEGYSSGAAPYDSGNTENLIAALSAQNAQAGWMGPSPN